VIPPEGGSLLYFGAVEPYLTLVLVNLRSAYKLYREWYRIEKL
jgi:hypothetical protein